MQKFSIKYFDGETASAKMAWLLVNEQYFIIQDLNELQIDIWERKLVKIDPNHLDGKFLFNQIEARARIEILDNEFFKYCPELMKTSYFQNKKVIYASILFLIMILVLAFYSLDKVAEFIVNKIPISAEQKMAEKMSLDHYFEVCSEQDQKAFQEILNVFLKNKNIEESDLKNIKLIKMPISNAFALPGNTIYVTEKLIQEAKSYDEIFGVIGHELGHAHERHPLKAIVRSSFITLFVGALSGDFSTFLIDPSTLAGLVNLKFDRSLEASADAYAVDWLKKKSLSNQGLINFFERTLKENRELEKIPSFLKTHPASLERIDAIKRMMPEAPEVSLIDEQLKSFVCRH